MPVLLTLGPRRRCHSAVPSQPQYEQNATDTNKGHLTIIPRPLRNDLLLSVQFLGHSHITLTNMALKCIGACATLSRGARSQAGLETEIGFCPSSWGAHPQGPGTPGWTASPDFAVSGVRINQRHSLWKAACHGPWIKKIYNKEYANVYC